MGPEMRMTRMLIDQTAEEDPPRAEGGDCEGRSLTDPLRPVVAARTIPLISDDEFYFTCADQ